MPKTKIEEKKILSKEEYIGAFGIFMLLRESNVKRERLEENLCEILEYEDGYGGSNYAGCISDAVYEGGDALKEFNEALEAEGYVLPEDINLRT